MKEILFICSFISLTITSFSQKEEIFKGIELYNRRAESTKDLIASPETINGAIKHFKNALKSRSTEEEAAVFLMKCYYFKGSFVEIEKNKRLEAYYKSKILGETMILKYPGSAAIYFWHLVNLAKWGETSGIMKSAREGLADKLKSLSEKVIELDPNYRKGGGYGMLGIIHYKTPYIPFILSWPDNDDAIENLEKCLQINSEDLMAGLYYAQVLHDEGEEERAITVLKKIISSTPREDNSLEDSKDIADAKVLLAEYE
ncbi:MAG TPA: tetratricopeptide repeat protein [Flavobacteriales bacterium]|nr:tetratricopeptide repeat protein [Flavobacteriales bacterium]